MCRCIQARHAAGHEDAPAYDSSISVMVEIELHHKQYRFDGSSHTKVYMRYPCESMLVRTCMQCDGNKQGDTNYSYGCHANQTV